MFMSVTDWPPLEDSERLEKVRRYHQLRESRDKAMLREDLVGYDKLRESAKSKTVGGVKKQKLLLAGNNLRVCF